MITPPIVVKIEGRDYPLAWGNMAKFRFASIPYAQRALAGPSFLTQLVWAAYAGGVSHPYATWEHLAPAVANLELAAYNALDEAMSAALPPPPVKTEGEPESAPVAEPTDAEKKSDSIANGPLPAAS
jgi:hypothetical protein